MRPAAAFRKFKRWSVRTAAARWSFADTRKRSTRSAFSACRSSIRALRALQVLQKFQTKHERIQPLIPLGTRGKLRRYASTKRSDFRCARSKWTAMSISWSEYLLLQPVQGLPLSHRISRTLERHPHACALFPYRPAAGRRKPCAFNGVHVHAFSDRQRASTTYVMGEFPWQVRVGEKCTA